MAEIRDIHEWAALLQPTYLLKRQCDPAAMRRWSHAERLVVNALLMEVTRHLHRGPLPPEDRRAI